MSKPCEIEIIEDSHDGTRRKRICCSSCRSVIVRLEGPVALAVSRTNDRFLIHQHSKEIEAHFLNRSPVD